MDYSKRIIEEYGGILPFHEAFYIFSIGLVAQRGVQGFGRYRDGLASGMEPAALIFELQSALSQAAAISRFFWPTSHDPLSAARGARLRLGYGLQDDDPLANRILRNALEHFDERLDKLLVANPVGPIVDMILDNHRLADDQLGCVLRLLDPDADIFVLLGEKFRFDGIEMSLQKINDSSITMATKGYRLLAEIAL